jgi:hypothetical protein
LPLRFGIAMAVDDDDDMTRSAPERVKMYK